MDLGSLVSVLFRGSMRRPNVPWCMAVWIFQLLGV